MAPLEAAKLPPNAAPAHLFGVDTAPANRLVVYSRDRLRAALHNALATCALDDVRLCVHRGASLEWRDEAEGQGMTPAHLVVCTTAPLDAKLALLTWLIEQKVNLEAVDHSDCTPLHCAAALGDAALVKALLKAGAHPGARDAEGLTALHLAANGGHAAVCAALAANWAPVDALDWEEGLPDTGADTSASARLAAPGASLYIARRGTPLHVSCAAGRPGCAAALIQAGADVNSRAGPHGCTPLHIAAREGHVPLALALLDAGARVDERDSGGETALMRAAEGGHTAMVDALLARGADAPAASARGLGALHIAAALGHAALFAPLVTAGADVNAQDSAQYHDCDGKRTPLMYAAHYGCVQAFKELQRLGADSRALSAAGWPSLFYAVENSAPLAGRGDERNRHLDVVRHILEQDAQDRVWCTVQNGRTALMVAAMQNAADAVRLLVDAQPWSLAWRDAGGRTAAHWAAVRGATDALEALMEKGADVRKTDSEGKTPGQLLPPMGRVPILRQWEAERMGAEGERRWDYTAVMEATSFRYLKKAAAARRVRQGAIERQCNACKVRIGPSPSSWREKQLPQRDGGASLPSAPWTHRQATDNAHTCQRFSFDALRCSGCRALHYCSTACQRKDWTSGGHRLWCGHSASQTQPRGVPTGGKELLQRMEERPW